MSLHIISTAKGFHKMLKKSWLSKKKKKKEKTHTVAQSNLHKITFESREKCSYNDSLSLDNKEVSRNILLI